MVAEGSSGSPATDPSVRFRKASRIDFPAYAARLHDSLRQPPEYAVYPGRFSRITGRAFGLASERELMQPMLLYVAPPSVETWTNVKSQPPLGSSSRFHCASKLTVPPAAGTLNVLTIVRSMLFPAPE